MELDQIDRKILRALQRDCRRGADALGYECGASPSTVLRRIKRMRKAGVITGEVAMVDPRKVGCPLTMIVGARLDREDSAAAHRFISQVSAHPAVQQFYFVTGSSDYIIHISAPDMQAYDDFVQLLVADPHVEMTETHVVIRPIKTGLSVPISD